MPTTATTQNGEEYADINRIRLFRFGCSYTHCIHNLLSDIDKTANVVIRKCVVSLSYPMIKCGVLQACATNAVSSCNMRSGSHDRHGSIFLQNELHCSWGQEAVSKCEGANKKQETFQAYTKLLTHSTVHETSEEAGTSAQPRVLRRSTRRAMTKAHEGTFEGTRRGIQAEGEADGDSMPVVEEDGPPVNDGHDDHDEDGDRIIVAERDPQVRLGRLMSGLQN